MAYLVRDRHGTFYLRMVLNDSQGRLYGKRELRRSLGTKLKREALRRQPEAFLQALSMLGEGSSVIPPKKPTKTDKRLLLSTLLAKYEHHQSLSGVLPSTIYKTQYAVKLLISLTRDKQVDRYTKNDVRTFRDKALKLPKKGYPDQTISVTTFNNYCSNIISFFTWCEREGYVDSNVFRGIKIKRKQQASSYREIFTREDLKRIFLTLETTPNIRPDRYWVPYIAYYTGCRINEACMLSKDDIYKVNDVWCIHFREDKPYQRLKNGYSERLVPIHQELINTGFMDYISSVKDERVFPMLRITKSNSFSAQLSQWFGKLLRSLDIGPNKTFHSFRHTVSHCLKTEGVDVSLAAALLGHSTNSITYDVYGKRLNDPRSLIEVVNKIPSLQDNT